MYHKQTILIAWIILFFSTTASAHNVWRHANCKNPVITVESYHRAGDVYNNMTKMQKTWSDANSHLESGVIAEFENKLDGKKKLNPHEFREALDGYVALKTVLLNLDSSIQELQKVDLKCETIPIHESTLAKILAEEKPLPRLTNKGVRYADAAGIAADDIKPISSTSGIAAAWRTDLTILSKTLDEVISGLRDALPLTEKGEFAAVMLSGRNAFGDKMPQLTEMISAFDRMYVRTVMATIATTMQVYPAGYEWLKSSKKR